MSGCCVSFCNTKRRNKISLHEFPSDLKIRNKWLQAIPLKDFVDLDHSKVCAHHFQKSDFVSLHRLKRGAIPSIFEECYSNETRIIKKEEIPEKRSLFVIEKSKSNESQSKVNANNLSRENSSDNAPVELVQTSGSEETQTQSNLSFIPPNQFTEIKSSPTSSLGSRLNTPSIASKHPIMPSFLMKKNVASIYVLEEIKTAAPMTEAAQTVTNRCTSFNNGTNYPGLLKHKADVNICVANEMLKISSTPNNKAVSFSRQSTCSSNESQSVNDTENGTTSASQLSHQLVSQNLPPNGETVTTSDVDNEEVGSDNESAESEIEIYLSNVSSDRFTGITDKISNQAGTPINLSHVSSSAARRIFKHTGLPQKYFNKNSYTFISELHRKNKNMISTLSKKNKKIRLLKAQLKEMSEKLEYYENHEVMGKVEKLLVINDKGLASNQIKFLLSQLSNLDKKTPRWPEDIVRECVLLHASSPRFYEALLKSELIRLPKYSTLAKFASSTKSETRNYTDLELESEPVTEIVNYEPEFELETGSREDSEDMEEDIEQYFNTSISDMF